MLNFTLKSLFITLLEPGRRMHEFLLALGAQRRCAARLDALADRLLRMGRKINRLREHMDAGRVGESMDADGGLRGSLKSLKEDIRDIRCQLASLQPPVADARLLRAFTRLGNIAEDTYAAADRLQWQIDEHERTPTRR